MNTMDVVCSGWLTKSPPEKKLLETWKFLQPKWRKRYFVLHKPRGSLPGTYALEYFKDEQCKKYVSKIDLEQCEEVTASLKSPLYTYLFLLRTKQKHHDRTYYLACDTEANMSRWVDCLCSVCNLKDDEEETDVPVRDTGENDSNSGAPPPPNRVDSISPTRLEGLPLSTSPDVPQHSTTLEHQPISVQERIPSDTLPMAQANEYVSDPLIPEAPGEGYIHLEDCSSGPAANQETVSPVKDKLANRYSIDSVPEEDAPPPPPKEANARDSDLFQTYDTPLQSRTDAWDPNDLYDSPPVRILPPIKSSSMVPPAPAIPGRGSTYDSPLRYVKDVGLSQTVTLPKKHASMQISSSSYSVPPPAARNRGSSSSCGSSGSKLIDSGLCNEFGRSFENMRISGSSVFDAYDAVPRNNTILLNKPVPPPPRPPMSEAVYYNRPPSTEEIEEDGGNFTDTSPSTDDMYDFPKSNVSISGDTTPPDACRRTHRYINAGSRTVEGHESSYLDMEGGNSFKYGSGSGLYVPASEDMSGELYTNLPTTHTNERFSLSQAVPLPGKQYITTDAEYYNVLEEMLASEAQQSSANLYMSPPSNKPVGSRGPPVDRRNKPKPLVFNNNDKLLAESWVQDTYQIIQTPNTKKFKRDSTIDWPSPDVRLPVRRGQGTDSSSSDEDNDELSDSPGNTCVSPQRVRSPPQIVKLLQTPPAPRRHHGGKVEYVELDLNDNNSDQEKSPMSPPSHHPVSPTDYREVDFLKTDALRETKEDLENKRKGSDTG